MSLSIKGKITQKLNIESGTSQAGKEWKKQGFLIDTGEQYNPNVCFSLFGEDKIEMLNGYEVGQDVEVFFNLSSREFKGKYYHNIDAWKIEAGDSSGADDSSEAVETIEIGDDDLPF